ncbi:MAG: DUF2283 domain-containing protein [Candidatus Hydrogenedentes bacterium]|nr:DUF2283 domain-containing protein [Candidatus Hydrogenedentota bacterium]
MSEFHMEYFDKEDVLLLVLSEDPEMQSIELFPNVTAELNEKGELIGIEILEASKFFRDYVLESMQAKLLGLQTAGKPV